MMNALQEYSMSIVAFIDILGFKDLVNRSEEENEPKENIQLVLMLLKLLEDRESWITNMVECHESFQKKDYSEYFYIDKRVNCTAVSDSIIVSVKTSSEEINHTISTLVTILSLIGAKALHEFGILLRGAITYGKIIHDKSGIVFGPALVDAYLLERDTAIMPRIILSNKLINGLNYPLKTKKDIFPYHEFVNRFDDGCAGFTQLKFYQVYQNAIDFMDEERLREELADIKKNIINGLDASFENPKVYSKWKWLLKEYRDLIIFGDKIKEDITDPTNPEFECNIQYKYEYERRKH